jgi:polyribonucleotide nucleotidyltransferase
VHYQEKFYAAGKIPGRLLQARGASLEKETLTSRLIDRPIRPLFVDGFRNEVLVMCTVLSHDLQNEPDVVAMIAASAGADALGRALPRPHRRGARGLRGRPVRA